MKIVTTIGETIVLDKETEETFEEVLRRIEREEELLKEAQENGFDTVAEYRHYLRELRLEKEYEDEVKKAEELGLSYEDYFCLNAFGLTYEAMIERCASCGMGIFHSRKTWIIGEMIDQEKFSRFISSADIISRDLDTDHRVLYMKTRMNNNLGKPVDEKMWKEIEELLSSREEEINKMTYVYFNFGRLTGEKYLNKDNENYSFKLTEEELEAIEECLKSYEG